MGAAMTLPPDLFAVSADSDVRFEFIAGRVPMLIIDNFYARPDEIRSSVLQLRYGPPPYAYPGRLASVEANPSLDAIRSSLLALVNREYLPRIPPIAADGKPIREFGKLITDFARTELHPDELSDGQRIPHVDPVPVFGLVYLNRADRGGTLFFRQRANVPAGAGDGYITGSTAEFELCGRIEGRFNRLAIYPGFILHSGEISGDWIRGEERFTEPRLTQRFIFLP
jgi:hypothetical protein